MAKLFKPNHTYNHMHMRAFYYYIASEREYPVVAKIVILVHVLKYKC